MSYHLIAGGIAADRLEAKGYGETRPVVVTRRIHKEYDFLPEDSTLTEAFILSLPEERQEVCNALNRRTELRQEVCNALNRRTEFKVLRTTYNLYEE